MKKSTTGSRDAVLRSTASLLRTLAHEVRNPLTNISLATEQLKPEITGEEASVYLDIIGRNCARIDVLISELLDLSRPAEISLEQVSLQTILARVMAAAADRITLKNIRIDLTAPDQPALIMADTTKLKAAFLNIIINATEALPKEAGKIGISIRDDQACYIVSISDNGPGIPAENLDRIFEPYFTSKTNGFGLGLASTWNILQSHGATIEANSAHGEGASFIIVFKKA